MRRMVFVLVVAAMFFFSGCTVSREVRIQKVRSEHPEWDQATVEQVADGRVEVGMTEEMVVAIMGRPSEVAREDQRDVWIYTSSETDSWGVSRSVPAFFVHVKGGRVAEIKGSQSRVVTPLLFSRS